MIGREGRTLAGAYGPRDRKGAARGQELSEGNLLGLQRGDLGCGDHSRIDSFVDINEVTKVIHECV
jgi:hypothetical protein